RDRGRGRDRRERDRAPGGPHRGRRDGRGRRDRDEGRPPGDARDRGSRADPRQAGGACMIPIARPLLGDEEAAVAANVIRSGMLATGPEVAAFEQEFATYAGVAHAIAVSNGTTALHATLLGAGVGPGDEVIVPSF